MHRALLDAALAAAEHGWHVFPIRPGLKFPPALHGYDRCPHTGVCAQRHQGWEQRATNDPDRIKAAWADTGPYAGCNVGIATGPSGLVVIDLDVPKPGDPPMPERWANEPGVHEGRDVLAVLAQEAWHPVPGDTYTVMTTSGGEQMYFTAPEGTALRNTTGDKGNGLGWKIDTRAHGGYVVAAGSIIGKPAEGKVYRALDQNYSTRPLPPWIASRLTPAPLPPAPERPIRTEAGRRGSFLAAAIDGETAKVRGAEPSQRNITLYRAAIALGQLVAGKALTDAEVTDALLDATAEHIAARAFTENEARKTIASGIRAGANRPRQMAA